MFIDYLETPLGTFEVMATDNGICQAIFCGQQRSSTNRNSITNLCINQLREYFEGKRQNFTVPLDLQSTGTKFQQSVWGCLSDIPFGEVCSYGEIAKALSNPKAAQAVGGANGRNPITIIVPCHRVIGRNGSLTGYAGGIERKLWLLNHEGVNTDSFTEHTISELETLVNKVKNQRQAKTQFLR